MMKDCPAPDVLAAFASGELTVESRVPIELHVSQCDACLETVGYLTSKVSRSESGAIAHPTLAEAEQSIGPYRLMRKIGEGGMGEVWQAQQGSPVRRTVALKLLKAGMDTRQIVARFEAERQVLALMQHPGIAQVFDAGITETGRPYFVMELVEGARITAYCDHANLSLRERLKLFQQVCEAVQHAHQKGVIHRDIKPSNVLIATQGGKALPKVIDFGLAKVITSELEDASLTELGTLLGTPAYASPEQMSLGASDIDTRSDVYSLGALLYELLIGVIPFEAESTQPLAMIELRRVIREREPTRPSVRLPRLGARESQIAQARGLEVRALRKQLRGDLDWIVMKALEKERERRYLSPHELSLDIDRYLNHEPLQAGPPTTAYRVRKFVRRHRIATAFAATITTVAIAFVVVTILQSQRIAEERDRATAEAAKATSINTFLQETLGSADPWQTGKDISIREVLDNAAKKADTEFEDQPQIAAAVKATIGRVYLGSGRWDDAERIIREALETRRAFPAPNQSDIATSLYDLAVALRYRAQFAESNTLASEALALRKTVHGENSKEVAETLRLMAVNLFSLADFDGADKTAREAVAIHERISTLHSDEGTEVLLTLASITARGREDIDNGLKLAHQVLDIYTQELGENHLKTANAHNVIGSLHQLRRDYEKALVHFTQASNVYDALTGRDNPQAVIIKQNVANTLARLGHFDRSVPLLEEVLAIEREKLGENATMTARTMANLAGHETDAGHFDRAQQWIERALPLFAQAYGEDHNDYAGLLLMNGELLHKTGQREKAEAVLRRSLSIRTKKVGQEHPSTAEINASLGLVLLDRRAYEEAESNLLKAHAVYAAQIGAEHAQTRAVRESLVRLYSAWNKPLKAAEYRKTE